MPFVRNAPIDSAPERLDSPPPPASVRRLWWPKLGAAPARASKNPELHSGIGDMILSANDVRHAEIDVVNHRGQRVEIGSILAAEDRIGERRAIDVAFAAHHVVPAHGRRFEPKTPMRACGLRLPARPARPPTSAKRPDHRSGPARAPAVACGAVEFLGGLIGLVKMTQFLEPRGGLVVGRHPLGLAAHEIRPDFKPFQIRLDRVGVFRPRALEIRVVEAQDERAPAAADQEPVQESGAGVADMDAAGRRRREPDHGKRGHSPS